MWIVIHVLEDDSDYHGTSGVAYLNSNADIWHEQIDAGPNPVQLIDDKQDLLDSETKLVWGDFVVEL